jgi:hypothetical protein
VDDFVAVLVFPPVRWPSFNEAVMPVFHLQKFNAACGLPGWQAVVWRGYYLCVDGFKELVL